MKTLVVRADNTDNRSSTFEEIKARIEELGVEDLFTINKTSMDITCKRNGNTIIFRGMDDEKIKSIHGVTMIWIEEASEIAEYDFNQLDIRLRGESRHYKQIIITFNPVSILHWLKKRFFDTSDPRAVTHRSTYKDNRFLDAEAVQTLRTKLMQNDKPDPHIQDIQRRLPKEILENIQNRMRAPMTENAKTQ